MPKISTGGKTMTVHIRQGVRFGPPVNREVTSADVKYAIERSFASSVANGYAGAYFGDLVGAPAKAPKAEPDIRGIQTPNKYTIVFELKQPDGVFVGALGMPMTAPVPQEYARSTTRRRRRLRHPPGLQPGPYMIEADASGNINGNGYAPGQLIELVRNPNWSAKTTGGPRTSTRSSSRRASRIRP